MFNDKLCWYFSLHVILLSFILLMLLSAYISFGMSAAYVASGVDVMCVLWAAY
jgi:hypothetical protein